MSNEGRISLELEDELEEDVEVGVAEEEPAFFAWSSLHFGLCLFQSDLWCFCGKIIKLEVRIGKKFK